MKSLSLHISSISSLLSGFGPCEPMFGEQHQTHSGDMEV